MVDCNLWPTGPIVNKPSPPPAFSSQLEELQVWTTMPSLRNRSLKQKKECLPGVENIYKSKRQASKSYLNRGVLEEKATLAVFCTHYQYPYLGNHPVPTPKKVLQSVWAFSGEDFGAPWYWGIGVLDMAVPVWTDIFTQDLVYSKLPLLLYKSSTQGFVLSSVNEKPW